MRLAVLTSGFPRRSETFALNELLALDRAGVLAAIFATKPGDGGATQPGVERLMGKVGVLAAGSPQQQAQEVVRRLEGRPVSGVHAYFAHLPAEVAQQAAARLARELRAPRRYRAPGAARARSDVGRRVQLRRRG
jgi:hypothetical protein